MPAYVKLINIMDIKIPSKFKINKIYLVVGLIVIIVIALIVVFKPTIGKQTKEAKPSKLTLVSLIKTSNDFFDVFPAEPKTKPKPKEKPKEAPKPKPKKIKVQKAELQFNENFNRFNAQVKTPDDAIREFLRAANNSSEVKTFTEFDSLGIDATNSTQLKSIETHYKSSNSKSSYPVDFSRVLTSDRNISAILINDINGSLPGKVIAQVESNIYAAHGRFILIPAGSKAIGYYQPLAKIGESRLQILWSRIITPKGVDIVINAELADQMGRSGLAGEVDTRFLDRYGLTLLISSVNAIAQYSVSTNENQALFLNTYGKDVSNISAKILEEQINVKPIISINAGARIQISTLEDIWFRDVDGKIIVQAFNTTKGKI